MKEQSQQQQEEEPTQEPATVAQQPSPAEFAEELKRLREMMQLEYEAKVRGAFEEIEELKTVLEETAREKQAKNDRTLQRQLEDKNGEIDELNSLVTKLQGKIKDQRGRSDQADKELQEFQ